MAKLLDLLVRGLAVLVCRVSCAADAGDLIAHPRAKRLDAADTPQHCPNHDGRSVRTIYRAVLPGAMRFRFLAGTRRAFVGCERLLGCAWLINGYRSGCVSES